MGEAPGTPPLCGGRRRRHAGSGQGLTSPAVLALGGSWYISFQPAPAAAALLLPAGTRPPAGNYSPITNLSRRNARKGAGRNDAAPSTTVANRMLIGKPKGQVVNPRLLLDWTEPYGLENGIASRKNPDPPGPSQTWRKCYSSM